MTAVLAGESDGASEYDMGSYFSGICPAGGREGESGGNSGSGSESQKSGDGGQYNYDAAYVETMRYGNIKGYG